MAAADGIREGDETVGRISDSVIRRPTGKAKWRITPEPVIGPRFCADPLGYPPYGLRSEFPRTTKPRYHPRNRAPSQDELGQLPRGSSRTRAN